MTARHEALRDALTGRLPPGDAIGRSGGDKFSMLSSGSAPDRLADRFDSMAAQRHVTFKHEERLVSVRLSFSVALAGSVPGDTAEALISRADGALYEVKRNGKAPARVAAAPQA